MINGVGNTTTELEKVLQPFLLSNTAAKIDEITPTESTPAIGFPWGDEAINILNLGISIGVV
jgi:hypothetical protein